MTSNVVDAVGDAIEAFDKYSEQVKKHTGVLAYNLKMLAHCIVHAVELDDNNAITITRHSALKQALKLAQNILLEE